MEQVNYSNSKNHYFFNLLLLSSLFLSSVVALSSSSVKLKPQTLGVSTTAQVLQASTQSTTYADMVLLTVSYANPSSYVTSATYCGSQMYKIGIGGSSTVSRYINQNVEMWYVFLPSTPTSTCSYNATFNTDPLHRHLSATIFHNIPTSDFLNSFDKIGSTGTDFTFSKAGPKDSMLVCAYSNNPNGGANPVNLIGQASRSMFSSGYKNGYTVQAGAAVSYQRTSDNQTMAIQWHGSQSQPWAGMCINLNVKAPTPPATPAPVPPAVDLKVNGSSGPVTVNYGTAITASWNATYATNGCVGSWSGSTLPATGTATIPAFTGTQTISILCVGADPTSRATDTVTVTVPAPPVSARALSVDLMVNGYDDPVKYAENSILEVRWFSTGTTSCEAEPISNFPEWTGSLPTNGTKQIPVGTKLGGNITIICKGEWGMTKDTVVVSKSSNVQDNLVSLRANGSVGPITMPVGGNLTLSWGTQGVTGATYSTCTASGGWTGTKAVSGNLTLSNQTAGNKNFVITCNYKIGTSSYTTSTKVYVNVEATTAVAPAPIKTGERGWMERFYKSLTTGTTDTAIFNSLKKTSVLKNNINYNWYSGSPDTTLLGSDYFAGRWTAQIIPWETGTYTFLLNKDDGGRVKVGSTYIINSWATTASTTQFKGTAAMIAGRPYTVTAEYFEKTGSASNVLQFGIVSGQPALYYPVATDNGI